MVHFLGRSEHALDKKNRLHLPKRVLNKISEAEQQNLVLARRRHRCLGLYIPQVWEDRINLYKKMASGQEDRMLRHVRILLMNAFELSVDVQGRILIPEHLKDIACIQDSVVVAGNGSFVEIWAQAVLEEYIKNKEPIQQDKDDDFDAIEFELERTQNEHEKQD